MNSDRVFQAYLERIGDELLECVAADIAALEELFRDEPPSREFVRRREACLAECLRRRRPELFRRAASIIHHAA